MPSENYEVSYVEGLEDLIYSLNDNFARLTQHLARIEGFDTNTPIFRNDVEMSGKRITKGGKPKRKDDYQLAGLSLSSDGFNGPWDAKGRKILNLPKGEDEADAINLGQIRRLLITETSQLLPTGLIGAWSGAIADIPAGWALCDGTLGTPDLRDRFLVGAGTTYNPDDVGGADSHNLAHTHTPGTLSTNSAGAHTHGPGTLSTDSDATTPTGTQEVQSGTGVTVASSTHTHSHSHNVNAGLTASDGAHTHNVDTGATGSSLSTIDNKPLYYALALIMKL